MNVELITFDAAQTIVRVDWNPPAFAIRCASAVGIEVDEALAVETYQRMLATRWKIYEDLNTKRDSSLCKKFWRDLTSDWLEKIGARIDRLDDLLDHADRAMYGPGSEVFRLYEDTVPALAALKGRGFKLAVVSNWDFSLHRVLQMLGLSDYFELVLASLEQGVEKPDPRIFAMALAKCGVEAKNALHVGDDPYDDIFGASQAGMRALLIDRSLTHPAPGVITSLHDIEVAIEWIA